MIEFTEHHGIENDMTGLRCWYAHDERIDYVIWQIPREHCPVTLSLLASHDYYRLNARTPGDLVWSHLSDEPDLEAAVARANLDYLECFENSDG